MIFRFPISNGLENGRFRVKIALGPSCRESVVSIMKVGIDSRRDCCAVPALCSAQAYPLACDSNRIIAAGLRSLESRIGTTSGGRLNLVRHTGRSPVFIGATATSPRTSRPVAATGANAVEPTTNRYYDRSQ